MPLQTHLKLCYVSNVQLRTSKGVLAMRSYSLRAALAATLCLLSSSVFSSSVAQAAPKPTGNGAIFFHPDGTSASHWDITRILYYGPDGFLNWDRLPVIAPYP